MAHKHTAPVSDDYSGDASNKQKPPSIDLDNCSSDSSEPNTNVDNLSPAEKYIIGLAEKAYSSNNAVPPENASTVSSVTSGGFSQQQDKWHENECNKIHKKEPLRYKYGSPPPASKSSTFQRFNSRTDDDDDDEKRSSNPLSAVLQRFRK